MGADTDKGDGFFFLGGPPVLEASFDMLDFPEAPRRRPSPRNNPNRVLDSSSEGSSILEPRVGVPHREIERASSSR